MALRAVPDHPKFARLKGILKLPDYSVIGCLELLWHFCGRFTPRGDIGKYSDAEIESWIEWQGPEGSLIIALLEAGWLDRHEQHRLVVHDWHRHADDASRMALKRANETFVATVSGQCSDGVTETPTVSGLAGAGAVAVAVAVPGAGAGPEPGPGAGPGPEPEPGAGAGAGPYPSPSIATHRHRTGAAAPLAAPEGSAASAAPASATTTTTATATATAKAAHEAKSESEIIADTFSLFCQVFHRDPRHGLSPLELVKVQGRLAEREHVRGSLDAAAQDFRVAIGHLSASELDRQPNWIDDLFKSQEIFAARLNGAASVEIQARRPQGGEKR